MTRRILAAGSLFALLAGCGGEKEPSLVPVSGTVTLNGKPLANAQVLFAPVDPKQPLATAGGDITGPQGNYKAMYKGQSGLAPGKYRVTVTKVPEASKVPADLKDDPYMASLAAGKPPADDPDEPPAPTEQVVDREVPPAGGTVDIDIKEDERPKTPKKAMKKKR